MTSLPAVRTAHLASRLMSFFVFAFVLLNSLFFFGIFFQLCIKLSFYQLILPPYTSEFLLFSTLLLGTTPILLLIFYFRDTKLRTWFEVSIDEYSSFIERHLLQRHTLWVAISSGTVLFLELSIIRWVSALFPELSQYRNFGLLGCFLGISLGYLSGAKRLSFVPFLLPLIGLQLLQVTLLSMFYPAMIQSENLLWTIAKSPLWQFTFIVAASIAPGQIVGRLMHKGHPLKLYGSNLLGSIVAVILFNLTALFWLPQWFWAFDIAFVYLLMFHRVKAFIQGFFIFLSLLGIAFVVRQPSVLEIYSPYQRVSVRMSGIGHHLGDGRYALYSNDLYYQSFSAIDTSKIIPEKDVDHSIPNADLGPVLGELKGKKVLALGAGAGGNVPSLLNAGVQSVVAVDIDPAIVYLGKLLNANYPYWDPKVKTVINDGRAFLRETHEKFDYIFFLWIDSHPYVTSASGFRIDSFIYTKECFQQAMSRLNPRGKILVYAWMNELSAHRILLTLKAATAHPIYTFRVLPHPYQALYIVSDEPIVRTGSQYVVPWRVEVPQNYKLRILTDDWPFLYLAGDGRGILRFLPFLLMVLTISLIAVFICSAESLKDFRKEQQNLIAFFLFGVAFMLLETTSIMRVALLMGNTWQVTGYVIIAVLGMAFLGNYLVFKKFLEMNLFILGAALIGSLLLSWWVQIESLESLLIQSRLAIIVFFILTSLPIIFSSVLFSFLIQKHSKLDLILGSNLLGCMVGGCLEYTAMIWGYKTLLLLVPVIYLSALILIRSRWLSLMTISPSSERDNVVV